MDKIDNNRRKWLTLGGVALGMSLLPGPVFATLSTPRPRILTLNNLNTGESIKAEFFDGRNYNKDELSRLNHIFRDYRANKVKKLIHACSISCIAYKFSSKPLNRCSLFPATAPSAPIMNCVNIAVGWPNRATIPKVKRWTFILKVSN